MTMHKQIHIVFLGFVLLLLFMVNGQKAIAQQAASNEKEFVSEQLQRDVMLDIYLIYTDKVCFGETGTIRLFIQDGTPPYDFQWSNGATSQDLTNVPPGDYEVTVTDGTGAEVIETATLEELPYMGSQLVLDITPVNCHSGSDGAISTSFLNNTSPYSYVWSTGSSAASISNLSAGDYSFTVSDAYTCEFDTVITIEQPDTIILNVNTSPASCYGSMDGSAWVEVTGGVPPDTTPTGFEYNYFWPSGVDNDTITWYGGTHNLSVSDASGCVATVPFTIDQPSQVFAIQAGNPQICIGGEATLTSQVTGGTAPYFFYWVNPSTNDTVYSNSMTVAPVETTNYIFFAEDMNGCRSNIVNSTVNVYPEISIAEFLISEDSICKGDPLKVELDIEGGNGGPYQIVNLNTGQVHASPFTIYPQQTQTYTLLITDACSTPAVEVSFDVTVMPDPPIGFTVDKRRACPPGTFYFNEFSPDLGQSYKWNFGDGQFSFDKTPVHIYTESAVYDVGLTVTSDFGCAITRVREELITIDPKPDAEFYVNSNHATILNPVIQFFNVSSNADSIYWYFGDGDSTLYSHANPWHEFDAVGWYNVKMVAENRFGCIDTTYKKVRIFDEYTFSAPTAFTPNNDGVNDCFRLCGHGVDEFEYILTIYDRYGGIVFETEHFENDLDCSACGKGSWDGTYNGSYVKGDELCEPGEYIWFVKYKDVAGVDNVSQGRVTLIR